MEELGGLGRAVRGLLASLPADTAVLLLSLLALGTLLRASRRVPLNSAFTRRPSAGVSERELREPAPDSMESGRQTAR